jgi:hypothetical protein
MAYWAHLISAAAGSAGLTGLLIATLRYGPRAYLLVAGSRAKNPERFRQAAEMIRLMRKDAKELDSYLTAAPMVSVHRRAPSAYLAPTLVTDTPPADGSVPADPGSLRDHPGADAIIPGQSDAPRSAR